MQKLNSNTIQSRQLQFIVTNDPEFDYELIQEVWLNEQLLADLRYVEGKWIVTFFVQHTSHQLSLADLTEIQHNFHHFVQERS